MSVIARLERRFSIRTEQWRQARRIHGGWFRLGLAVIGIHLSRLPIPFRGLRERLFRDLYARMYPPGLNEQEAERPLGTYRSLNGVFTRALRAESRPIAGERGLLVSPCDGTVQDVDRIEGDTIVTVKGLRYSLASLLPEIDVRPYEGGSFAIVFLSPIDCHRVFSPIAGRIEQLVHVPGARLLVHPPFQRPEFPVYQLNERVLFRLEGEETSCLVVMVAGWGVGNITVPVVPGFRRSSRRVVAHTLIPRPFVNRGEWMATFELGSTVVILAPASPHSNPLVSPGQKIRYGQPIFRLDLDTTPR